MISPVTKEVFGWTLPAADAHFGAYLAQAPEAYGRRVYQPMHIAEILKATTVRRVAIDVGAHVGFWSYYLAHFFAYVHAFEPVAEFAQCFRKNVTQKNVCLHETALGNDIGCVAMETPADNSGMSHIRPNELGAIPITRLDTFEFSDVDFIKIDVEGYEKHVLEGAHDTLTRNKPIVIVEQKSGSERYAVSRYEAVEYLESLGAVIVCRVIDDYIVAWPNK